MSIPFLHLPATVGRVLHQPATVGREDRLVRGSIAFSLLLLASFPVLVSGAFTPITVGFFALGLYFALTAALGRDPLYTHFGIDTGADQGGQSSPVGGVPAGMDPAVDVRVVDVRDSNGSPTLGHRPDQVTGS